VGFVLRKYFADRGEILCGVAISNQVVQQPSAKHLHPSNWGHGDKFYRGNAKHNRCDWAPNVSEPALHHVLKWEMPGTKHLFLVSERSQATCRIFRVEARCTGSTLARHYY
jgi:hypothetical protein